MASINLVSISSNKNASLDDAGYLINAVNGTITVTLPDMTGIGDGASFILVRTDLNINVNVVILPTNTTINSTTYVIIPIETELIIVYTNGVWNLTTAADALLTNNYKFDYTYINGIPTIYSAFEDIMDLVSLTCYDDAAVLTKTNSVI